MLENTQKKHLIDDGEIVITQKIMAVEVVCKESTNYLEQEIKNWQK